jgi:hypothetical protein
MRGREAEADLGLPRVAAAMRDDVADEALRESDRG